MHSTKSTFLLTLSPEQAAADDIIRQMVAARLRVPIAQIASIRTLRRSIDARGGKTKILLTIQVFLVDEPIPPPAIYRPNYPKIDNRYRAIIVGAGPAGLFAALRLIELGIKPIIIERGKDVRDRRRDLAAINKQHLINPDSNYCFGEGGAGTYSDGKLYTRSDKRGNIRHILEIFVAHGADPQILIEAHPHIGTNKLPKIIETMRQSILDAGGEVHFNTRMSDLYLKNGKVLGIVAQTGDIIAGDAVLLATGHSARDVFALLHHRQIAIEAKPFALGVRIEHPQALIDQMQYKCSPQKGRGDYLPPAAYTWVEKVGERGVYSFCMCPGGIIAPCATDTQEIVTNGWSPSRRNNPFANSGIVTEIRLEDLDTLPRHHFYAPSSCETMPIKPADLANHPLRALFFQAAVERQAWLVGGQRQTAPAQRLPDFLHHKRSISLPECSYQPGVVSALLTDVLPPFVAQHLHGGLAAFCRRASHYYTDEAILVGVESRTSSPVRIPRQPDTLQHPQVGGLYPCGEGAGYAGGIVSAAIDGVRCAEAIASYVMKP